jgi:hypothetical protein
LFKFSSFVTIIYDLVQPSFFNENHKKMRRMWKFLQTEKDLHPKELLMISRDLLAKNKKYEERFEYGSYNTEYLVKYMDSKT